MATTTVAYGADTCRTMVDEVSLNKDNLFNTTLCIDGGVQHASKNKVEDFIDQFKHVGWTERSEVQQFQGNN